MSMLLPLFLFSVTTCVHSQYVHKRSPIEELEHMRINPKYRPVEGADSESRSYELAYAFPPRWTDGDYPAPYDYDVSPEDEAYYAPQQDFDTDMMYNYLEGLQRPPPDGAFEVERRSRKTPPAVKETNMDMSTTAPESRVQTQETATTASTQRGTGRSTASLPAEDPKEAPFRPLYNHLRTSFHSKSPIPLMKHGHRDTLAEELSSLKKKKKSI